MGYRYDRRDGRYKLLDVNPRLGATFRLFIDSNELDVVRVLYLDLTDQPVRPGVPREGRKWIVEPNDLWASLQSGLAGRLTPAEWARSLWGIEEGAWFAREDLVPFAAMCWASLVKVGRELKDKTKAARDPAASCGGSPATYLQSATEGRQKGKTTATSECIPATLKRRFSLTGIFQHRAKGQ